MPSEENGRQVNMDHEGSNVQFSVKLFFESCLFLLYGHFGGCSLWCIWIILGHTEHYNLGGGGHGELIFGQSQGQLSHKHKQTHPPVHMIDASGPG